MLHRLRRHPFPVEAHFRRSTVLTYAVPAAELTARLPPPLALDNYGDVGFVAVAMVDTHALRPAGFPAFLGNDFFLIGYRIFVRYRDARGRNLRGLYILRSETNKRKMEWLGSLFTRYRYGTIDVLQREEAGAYRVRSAASDIDVTVVDGEAVLPEGSCFPDWKTARRFAGPLPFTFTYLEREDKVLWVEGRRTNWRPEPVTVREAKVGRLEKLGFGEARLVSAFKITDVPYRWRRGHVENWPT